MTASARALGEFVGREIRWTQPRVFEKEYLLRWLDTTLGTMRFRSCLGSEAEVESEGRRWTFTRTGILSRSVGIRRAGSNSDLAVFRNNAWASGGCLEFPDGRRLIASSNFWSTEFCIQTESGEQLVSYRQIRGLLRLGSTVEIHPRAAAMSELPWLVALGWYLTVLQHRDAAVVAA